MRSFIIATFIFFILIIVPTFLYSDEAQQTDWSGGDGVLWPVLDWGNEFWQSSDINWSDYPGSLLLSEGFLEHIVDGGFNDATSVYSEDIDGDGDMDMLGTVDGEDKIIWWKLDTYSPVGTLESSILDLGNDPGWGAIDWSESTPSGASVSFLVMASDDYTIMGAWSDTLTAPCNLDGILNDYNSYFQYKVLLETVNLETTPSLHDVTLSWDPLGIGETSEPIPTSTTLLPISPNPVKGTPVIRFGLPEPASVEISIFDLSGRLVSEIHGDEYSPGFHNVLLGDFSPGIYFCRMISGDFTATQRFVVIK